jgi:hypothetical protein
MAFLEGTDPQLVTDEDRKIEGVFILCLTMATISKGIMDQYMATIKKLRLNSNAYTWIRAYDSTLEKRPSAIKKRSS